jgi:exosome complex component CSL4
MAETQLVLPGDEIAISEEFSPGEGTFEKDGVVFAAVTGKLQKDMKNRVVHVKAMNPPVVLRIGDVVYGTVEGIRNPIITVKLLKARGSDRSIAGDNVASLHISKVSKAYTTDIRKELRIGDIVKAAVIQVKPSLQLQTTHPDLGVVRAECHRCRTPLERKQRSLYCPKCDRRESRKIARDYDEPPL